MKKDNVKNRENKNLFYDYMDEKMMEHSDLSPSFISYKRARYILERFNIPKWLQMPIIKEMIQYKYLSRESLSSIKVANRKVDTKQIKEDMINSKEKINNNTSWTRRIKKKI